VSSKHLIAYAIIFLALALVVWWAASHRRTRRSTRSHYERIDLFEDPPR
jgi:hypothetical protein